MISIEVIEDLSALRELQPDWNPLLAKSWSKSIFLTWEWIETWWQAYNLAYDLLVLVARDKGVVCGIAPLVVRRGPSPRLEFLGQNEAYGEYLDFLVPSGIEHNITPILCERVIQLGASGKWRDIHLATILADSPNLTLVADALAKGGIGLERSPVRACPFVELPASWEELMTLKGKRLGKRILYNERRLARSGKVVLEFPKDESEIDEFFDTFVELNNRRWGKPMNSNFFAFHRRIAHLFFGLNQLLLCRLRAGQMVVAVKYDFVFDNKVWGYQGGWLPEFEDREVGSVLLCQLFRCSIEREHREYDFLEGDTWYKRRWSTSCRHAFDLIYGSQRDAYIY